MKANKLGIKAILLAVVCVLMVTIGASPANAVPKQKNVVVYKADFHFVVDGQVYHAPKDTQGFLYNNRTYVPIRFASYLLEKSVEWSQSTSTVSVKLPTESQLKQLQNYKKQYLMPNVDLKKPASSLKKETIYALVDAAGYNFFGKEQKIPEDVTTFMHKGTLYVPLRYFAELIQHDISYSSATHTITMKARSSSGNGNSNTDGTTTNPGSGNNENPGSGSGDVGTTPGGGSGGSGGVTTPGEGEVEKPTRAELVSATEKKMKALKNSLTPQVMSLYTKYTNAKDQEEAAGYISEGLALLDKADTQVDAILEQLNADLEKYDYDIGDDAANFDAQYKAEKAALYEKLS